MLPSYHLHFTDDGTETQIKSLAQGRETKKQQTGIWTRHGGAGVHALKPGHTVTYKEEINSPKILHAEMTTEKIKLRIPTMWRV